MSRRRFYAPPEAFAREGAEVALSADEARHLRDVLRLRAGDEAFVFDGEGREYACVVADAGGRSGGRTREARLEVVKRVEPPRPESPLALTLAVALLKGEKFDLVVQKATELGASRVAPVLTKRTDVRLRDERDAETRLARWRRLALEAAKQSGRARVPEIASPVNFSSLVSAETEEAELRVMFAEGGGGGLDEMVAGESLSIGGALALVGPEGGWDEDEVAEAGARGWAIVTLGGRTLRAETAAITAAVLIQHLFGDLR